MRVSVNDIKKFTVPDTSRWHLNPGILEEAKAELNCNLDLPVHIDFIGMETFTLDALANNPGPKLIVVPDWPCMSWYKPLHDYIYAEARLLPNVPHLFLDQHSNALGKFAWRNWLFYVTG